MKYSAAISELALSIRIDASNVAAIAGRGDPSRDQADECDRLRWLIEEKTEAIRILRAHGAEPEKPS
jgi:hypothetical protein